MSELQGGSLRACSWAKAALDFGLNSGQIGVTRAAKRASEGRRGRLAGSMGGKQGAAGKCKKCGGKSSLLSSHHHDCPCRLASLHQLDFPLALIGIDSSQTLGRYDLHHGECARSSIQPGSSFVGLANLTQRLTLDVALLVWMFAAYVQGHSGEECPVRCERAGERGQATHPSLQGERRGGWRRVARGQEADAEARAQHCEAGQEGPHAAIGAQEQPGGAGAHLLCRDWRW